MIIDKDLLAFIQPVCNALGSAGAQPQLLSLPYSYASYSLRDAALGRLRADLLRHLQQGDHSGADGPAGHSTAYLDLLSKAAEYAGAAREGVFLTTASPLEHRYLDQMIEQKIADGSWKVVYTSSYGDSPYWDNHWQLIRTTP